MYVSRRTTLSALPLLLNVPSIALAAEDPDFDLIKQHLREDFSKVLPKRVNTALLRNRRSDGSWSDVDYGDTSAARWLPVVHLERMRSLSAAVYVDPSQSEAFAAISEGLRYWIQRRPTSTNWWQNTIGQQLALAPTLVLLWDRLPAELRQIALSLFVDPSMVPAQQARGQNLIWYAQQQLIRGALSKNEGDLLTARDHLTNALTPSASSEGIQVDFSFHQHGPQLYTGGYGRGYATDITRVAGWLQQTRFQFSDTALTTLADYILIGIAPLIRGNWLDWSARGREFTREERQSQPRLLEASVRSLAGLVPARAAALTQLAEKLASDTPQAGRLGSVAYWRSDLLVHQTAASYTSVRVTSNRTIGAECGNGENLLGYWTPFGLTYFIRQGNEYSDMESLWDWAYLPGVTCPSKVPSFSGLLWQKNILFAGCLSDGKNSGVAALKLDVLDTRAKKAWFINGDWMVALGCGIESSRPEAVHTTINQVNLLSGPSNIRAGMVDAGARVTQGGATYYLGPNTSGTLRIEQRSAGRSSANPALGPTNRSATVWTMYVDHGTQPSGARYEYAAWLGANAGPERAAYEVLANDPIRQAVHFSDGSVQAVIHEPGALDIGDGYVLTVGAACLLIVRPQASSWAVQVSDPSQRMKNIAVSMAHGATRTATVNLALPVRGSLQAPWGNCTFPRTPSSLRAS